MKTKTRALMIDLAAKQHAVNELNQMLTQQFQDVLAGIRGRNYHARAAQIPGLKERIHSDAALARKHNITVYALRRKRQRWLGFG